MKFVDEFKQFALKGNVIDMAVGVVIGASFGKIIDSAVKDVMMPPLGLLVGGIDFSNQEIILKPAHGFTPPVALKYGLFINSAVSFLIVAFTIFVVVKAVNTLKKKEANYPTLPPPVPSKEEELLTEIRDLLKNK